jgi:hypothetical protein
MMKENHKKFRFTGALSRLHTTHIHVKCITTTMGSIMNCNLIETLMKRNVWKIRLIKRCHLGEDTPNWGLQKYFWHKSKFKGMRTRKVDPLL